MREGRRQWLITRYARRLERRRMRGLRPKELESELGAVREKLEELRPAGEEIG